MKIDLHCHTKKTKKGDNETRNVTPELFKEKIINSNVKIVGITNHNVFDKQQYIKLKESVKGLAQVWPGIELDIKYKEAVGHLITIYNPDKCEEFELIVKGLVGKQNIDNIAIDLDIFIKNFCNKDAIFIAHDFNKSQSFNSEMIEVLKNGINERHRVFSEPSNLKSLSIMLDNGIQGMLGSDIKDWNKYPNTELPELKLDIDSFEKLVLLAKKDKSTINTLLNKKEKKLKEIKIKISDTKKEKVMIPLYNDINIIFGTKGTGKSKLLEGIKDKYVEEGNSYSYYKASDVDEIMDQKLKFKETERTNTNLNIKPIENVIEDIRKWEEINPTSLNDYVEHIKTSKNNKNKSKLKIVTLKSKIKDKSKFDRVKAEYQVVKEIIDKIKQYKLEKYLNEEESEQYKILNEKLQKECFNVLKNEHIEYYSNKLTNSSIRIIKRKADLCTTSKSLPDETGFLSFAQNHIKLMKRIKDFKESINCNSEKKIEKIGNLDGGKEVYLSIEHRIFKNNTKEFKYGQNVSDLRKITTMLSGLDAKYRLDIASKIDDIKEAIEKINLKAKDFIGIKKQYENQEGQYYKPSDGEKIMLILHKKMFEDADVYLLDEPERSLGNTFINSIIVPRIIELGKMNKTIVIATHNANIAVRTLPFISILKCYENGKYNTYVGNPFINELTNIDDEGDIKIWKDESIKILEGGKEAFYDRRVVYESR